MFGLRLPLLALVALGCAPKARVPDDAVQELPPWMTKDGGEKVRMELIDDLLDSGNTLGALDIIRSMRSQGFDDPELDLQQGRALRLDGVASEAERLLVQAQRRLPHDARPASELCILYADLKRLDEAVDRCRRATEIDDNDARAWNNLGFLLLAASEPEQALEAAEQALEIDAAEPRYRNNLAMAQAALGRDDQAFRTFQSTMPRADAAYMVGTVVERFRGPDVARPWYERALELQPAHPEASEALHPTADAERSEGGLRPPVPPPDGSEGGLAPIPIPIPTATPTPPAPAP